jgi:hypothetical protein
LNAAANVRRFLLIGTLPFRPSQGWSLHLIHAPSFRGPPQRAAVERSQDGDLASFERLSQYFERAAVELGQLVEKQHVIPVNLQTIISPQKSSAKSFP